MIPKPFKRPGIEIGKPTARRWVTTMASSLDVEDIVEDKGMVTSKIVNGPTVYLGFFSGESFGCNADRVFRAFTEGESVGLSK